jgi:hypothetical protein
MRAPLLTSVFLLWGLLSTGCDSEAEPPADAAAADGSVSDAGGAADAAVGADGAVAGATVMGTLTLPGNASGRPWFVRIASTPGGVVTPVAATTGVTTGSDTLQYSIAGVRAGTYYLLGFVDVDASGGTASTPGDYVGWYGHTGDGNPPAAPSVVVPSSGTVTFDFSLVLR